MPVLGPPSEIESLLAHHINREVVLEVITRGLPLEDKGLAYAPRLIADRVDRIAIALESLARRVDALEISMTAKAKRKTPPRKRR